MPGQIVFAHHADWPLASGLVVAGAIVLFGLIAIPLRRHYRHASEVRRMVLLFAALFAPVLAAYPLAAASADRQRVLIWYGWEFSAPCAEVNVAAATGQRVADLASL